MGIAQRYEKALEEVRQQCIACGRSPEDVLLLAVSKTVGVDGVAEAASAGAKSFGENRPDQIVEKHEVFPNLDWHFIGNIQSRRIKDIVASANLIHSLSKSDHARKISEHAKEIGKVQDVLLEVNVSGEESKSGVTPDEALPFIRECADLDGIRFRGLMTMAPQGDAEVARACFASLHDLHEQIKAQLPPEQAEAFDQISAGMSEDWPEAIAEGSTIVRVGRAIFSDTFAG